MDTVRGTRLKEFDVGNVAPVHVLTHKLKAHDLDDALHRRLSWAVDRAATRFEETERSADAAFYHGLLTGYAVAMRFIERPPADYRRANRI
jgi:hypothetical protein